MHNANIIPLKSSMPPLTSSSTTPQLFTEALRRALAIVVARSQADLELVRERADAIVAAANARVAETEARIARLEQSVADRLAAVRDGADGKDGERGEPGERGLPGDKGEPGCAGRDGRSFAIRGTWLESETYCELDVVALNGASFGARRDDPGPCPGDGWQLIAAQGKRGNAGERGASVKGERGPPGVPPASIAVDDDGMLTLTNADGSRVTCDLYPLLSRLT
jgi:hypothetical protein